MHLQFWSKYKSSFFLGAKFDVRILGPTVSELLMKKNSGKLARNRIGNPALGLARASETRAPAYSRDQLAAIW